jgi:hypothetical protein
MTTLEVLEHYERIARPWLNQIFKPQTCIEQTRLLIEVLARWGINAWAMGAVLTVTYPAAKYIYISGCTKQQGDQIRGSTADYRERPSSDGTVYDLPHVVAIVENSILVDMTIAQASFADKDLVIDPVALVVALPRPVYPASLLPDLTIAGELAGGTEFEARWVGVADRSFERYPAWDPSHLLPLIDRIADTLDREQIAV